MNDKVTIGLTAEAQGIMGELMELELFNEERDAAKFALSVAVNLGVEPGQAEGTNTKWNVGSFDSGGELANLLVALYPDVEAPYRLVEYFVNAGMQILGEQLRTRGEIDVVGLMRGQN